MAGKFRVCTTKATEPRPQVGLIYNTVTRASSFVSSRNMSHVTVGRSPKKRTHGNTRFPPLTPSMGQGMPSAAGGLG